tara:strand:- start:22 stop:723 length:702 start_codon:yes stop_codon:yes gene_type:complete
MVKKNILITGTSKGIGKYLAEYYLGLGFFVIGCSRSPGTISDKNYKHFCLDISNEQDVKNMFFFVRKELKCLDILINNAGVASMNHSLLTPVSTIKKLFYINVLGTYICCREAAKLMRKTEQGRIINFGSVATPLKLEGEAIYAATKASVVSLTEVFAKEFADYGITVNAIAPTPIKTDLIKSVPENKLNELLQKQTIKRFGKFKDVSNTIDYLIKPESDFITGQIIYFGGVS